MQSRTEPCHSPFTHRLNPPRGYMKKRKRNDDPPDIRAAEAQSVRKQYLTFPLTLQCLLFIWAFLSLEILIVQTVAEITTIEPDMRVLGLGALTNTSLGFPSTPSSLRNGNGTLKNGNGICTTLDIRYDLKSMDKLTGCRVVEGSVSILLIDDVSENDTNAFSFPELVEITGFLLLYRISGIRSLYNLFPNLALIRGRDIFNDYSLIIYEFDHLEEIGLINLQSIQRGAVRIEKNEKLCFADRIDWSLITAPAVDHYIQKNKRPHHCPICNKKQEKCPLSKPGMGCWNQQLCQTRCDCNIGSKVVPCMRNGTCCDPSCLGGCEENFPKKCKACRDFSITVGGITECREKCPPGTYEYLQRRCVTRKECFDLNSELNSSKTEHKDVDPSAQYIPFDRICMIGCPAKYVDYKRNDTIDCKPCGNDCKKKCSSKIIDSISAAHILKGCAIIDGPLEIQIRRSSKSMDFTNNVVKELEVALADIVEITDYLKIARTFPLVSLSFLKNLKVIKGKRLESNKYSLVIWDNQNLQELWDEHQVVKIEQGQLFFHFNPKLCFFKIERLTDNQSQIENYETAKISNGDKIPCQVTSLSVTVVNILPQAAVLTWKPLKLEDERGLLSYVVYYTPAAHKNVTLWDGRDACGNDGWLVDDVNDFVTTDFIAFPLTNLEPFQQYAFYVKAYTIAREKTGAQSDIQYFTTLPGMPLAVTNLEANAKNSSSIEVTWGPPKKINGKLSHYTVRVKLIEDKDEIFDQQLYCDSKGSDPYELQNFPTHKADNKQSTSVARPKPPSVDINGQCDCNTCALTCQKEPKEGDEQRQSAIDFEDQIQDLVYVKTVKEPTGIKESRSKRQVESVKKKITENKDNNSLVNLKNADGEYTQFNELFVKPEQLSFKLVSLRHYSNYLVTVRACREKSKLPLKEPEKDEECGPEATISVLTAKKEENDLIPFFDAVSGPSNNSLGSIKVSWTSPTKPNGQVIVYLLRIKRNDIEQSKPDEICVTQRQHQNQSFHLLDKLSNGNYSIQIAARSMAGVGNYTANKYVTINEDPGLQNWHILMIVLGFLIFVCGLFTYWVKFHYMNSISNMKLIANVNPDYAGVQYKLDDWEVPRDKIIQLQELGQGSFGMVYEGIIKDYKKEGREMRCAIKTVGENATDKERVSFLNEASVMKKFDTAFVVRLLGVVSQSQPTFVVMELMLNGDLKGYLRSHRSEYDNGSGIAPEPPTLRQILQTAAEIADGMSYLAAMKFVHRDLAARNCMVAEDLTVKIGDFGMTRDIYETDYYRKGTKGLLPVRWMSPESLKDGVFTSSSDVFSYGVVLWEISTLASQPYQGLSNDQVLRYVIEGGVMERPENCPDKLYELMRRCWQHRPSARPTFMEIIETLLDDVNQNFRNIAFFFSKEAQEQLHQQRQGEYAQVNMSDDVTTPLRQGEEETSSLEGNHFLMEQINNDGKFHEL